MQNDNSLNEFRHLLTREHDNDRLQVGKAPYSVTVNKDSISLSVNHLKPISLGFIDEYVPAFYKIYGLLFQHRYDINMDLFSKCNFTKFHFEFSKLASYPPKLIVWNKQTKNIHKIRSGPIESLNQFNSLMLRSQE